MSLPNSSTKSSGVAAVEPATYDISTLTTSAPESVGSILGKISIVWAGLFAGITLSDVVLFATLIYTVLQICLAVYERIIKPIHSLQDAARVVKHAADRLAESSSTSSTSSNSSSNGQSGPQEK